MQENITTTLASRTGVDSRANQDHFAVEGKVTLAIRAPTRHAQRICEGLNKAMGEGTARPWTAAHRDQSPERAQEQPSSLPKLGDIGVSRAASRASSERAPGTIVAGGRRPLSPVAIAQGGITIS